MLFASLVIGYFVIQTTGYMVHKALHLPVLGIIHRTHDIHHRLMYPPDDYLDAGEYREVEDQAQPFKYYAAASVPLLFITYYLMPFCIFSALALELLLVAWLNDWLHQKLHIKGHWLEKFRWFHRLRALHWHHHVDDTKNLGIFSWGPDKVLGTFQEPLTTPTYLDS